MKISVNWLKDYISLDEPGQVLSQDLSMLGLAVDTVESVDGDTVLDIDVPANRPDCLNHLGIARELSVLYRDRLQRPVVDHVPVPSSMKQPITIEIDADDLCYRYCGLVISGITVAPSPAWMQRRLEVLGQRPINNIVDVTNYVLLELGHPLHAFDYRRLREGRIVVRRARDGETIRTLDDEMRTLDPDMLVIADADVPVAVAGVMGGADSEVGESTTDILLESAWFLPASVRRTGRRLGLSSEAAYRFERGADLAIPPYALLRAASLILALGGGEVASPVVDACPRPPESREIVVRKSQVERLVGVKIDRDFVNDILPRLEFGLAHETSDAWTVRPPIFRVDVGLEVDVIEEVARFYGYNRIPATLPEMTANPVSSPKRRMRDVTRDFFKEAGFQEILTTSFASRDANESFDFFQAGEAIRVDNPLDEEEPFLRTNLMGQMLQTLKLNENNFNQNVRLFEAAAVHFQQGQGWGQQLRLVLGAYGDYLPVHWMTPGQPLHFFHLKGVLEKFFERLGLRDIDYVPEDSVPFLQPGSTAKIMSGKRILGVVGRMNELVARQRKFRQVPMLGELDLEGVMTLASPEFVCVPLSRYPFVDRDVSFTVDNKVAFSTIIKGIYTLKIPELYQVKLIDLYRGPDIPADRSAMTLRLVFQHPERTLTDEEGDKLRDRVTKMLVNRFKVVFR